MGGTVVSISTKQGQTLNSVQQAPTILRIADMSTMTVQTQVSEADVSKLRPGMESYFTTLGGQGRRWYGSLRKLEPTPTVTNNVVLYNALFDVPNTNSSLLPNMTAQVFFAAAQARNVLLVPAAAVVSNRGARSHGQKPDGAAASALHADSNAVAKNTHEASQSAAKVPQQTETHKHQAAPANAASAAPAGDEDAARAARRAQWAAMSPEEREAMRERRKAEGGGESPRGDGPRGDGPRGDGPPPAPPNDKAGPRKNDDAVRVADASGSDPAEAEQRKQVQKTSAPSARASGPVDRGLAPWGNPNTQRAARKGKIRVIDADGKIEEREVTLGISNRVQVEILAGLSEGEEVIAGDKLPANDKQSSRNSSRQQQQGGGMPPMGPPPGGR
jgi:macrolide-specific efflux system membrane fusion protein